MEQPGAQLPGVAENLRIDVALLVAGRGEPGIRGDGLRHVPGQRTIAGMGQENVLGCHRELMAAQFFVCEDFGNRHGSQIKQTGGTSKGTSPGRTGNGPYPLTRVRRTKNRKPQSDQGRNGFPLFRIRKPDVWCAFVGRLFWAMERAGSQAHFRVESGAVTLRQRISRRARGLPREMPSGVEFDVTRAQ